MSRLLAGPAVAVLWLVPQAYSQTPAKMDFARDVQPIFRQNCVGCHGPAKQNNGLRLDRRSSVLKLGARRVVPGSLENSLLYRRLLGPSDFGIQMPPTGPLRAEQIRTIKVWVEQGAEWPDSLANEIELPPLNPKAVAMVEALRMADRQAFQKIVAEDPKLLNARGPEGSTPFMYAVLYTDAATLERLIKQGADPNKRNDAGATALIWAAVDLEKTRVLLAHGAEVNAKSDDARTPLMIASGRPGAAPIVKLLLAHGAKVNPTSNPGAESSPLLEASLAGDAETMKVLLDRGADLTDIAGVAIINAVGADCMKCVDLLIARKLDAKEYTVALVNVAVMDNPDLIRRMLDHGADVNAPDPTGRTALMYAAVSDTPSPRVAKLLLDKGAQVNAKSTHAQSGDTGRTALDIARMHGETPLVDLLLKSGAVSGVAPESEPPAPVRSGNSIQAAVSQAMPLLDRADLSFIPKTGCFSCHNDSLAAIARGLARKRGFHLDERISALEVKANMGVLEASRDDLRQGFYAQGLNANPSILSFVLLGLDAEGYKPDLNTDAVAMFLQSHQMADGHWAYGPDMRPPLCGASLQQTVLSMRALQLYAPQVNQAAYAKSIQLAATWIGEFQPRTNYDLAWRLQGLVWGGKSPDAIAKARRDLLAAQRPDGGWSDIASMESGAFTTGLAMMAIANSGLPVSDPAYQHGVRYLLSTQQEDGSWHVRTRAAGFQPYFDNGFPHGLDQWISSAGTSLATIALTLAAPGDHPATAARAER
jgi:ankyrin repeat protein